jgi:hemoglobin-like flavoprotein
MLAGRAGRRFEVKNYLEFFLDSLYHVWGDPAQQRDFLTRFYETFTEQSPQIAAHFEGTDMERQKEMLTQSIHEMVEFSTTRVASERLRQVALRHNRRERNVAPELYEVWLDSLIATAREFDVNFNDELELAWRVVLAPGIAYMKFRYDHF